MKIVVFHGYVTLPHGITYDPLPEVERFDPTSGVWSETVAMNTPRVGGAAAVTGGAPGPGGPGHAECHTHIPGATIL